MLQQRLIRWRPFVETRLRQRSIDRLDTEPVGLPCDPAIDWHQQKELATSNINGLGVRWPVGHRQFLRSRFQYSQVMVLHSRNAFGPIPQAELEGQKSRPRPAKPRTRIME